MSEETNTEPALRTKDQINKEYTHLAAQLGNYIFQLSCHQHSIVKIEETVIQIKNKMKLLNEEVAQG